jgi:DNA-binding NtrC family response regulator
MREGAADYFAKPWNDDKLLATVKSLLRLRELAFENTRLRARAERTRRELAQQHRLNGLVYASDVMHELVSLAVKVAPSEAPVLITGPNGSGKERLADLIHANSRRRDKPFVKVNAGGLSDSLLEAELFGAEAGAYTGATKLRIGRFEAAHGGTLLLDELGNLSASGQMKLLRVLQTGEFERVGSSTTRKVDVRLVSATNADLPRAIEAGTFREDLYFRLNVIELFLPPLAERSEDILPLCAHFLAELSSGAELLELGRDGIEALLAHDWPGNVRELQNRLHRASLVCRERTLRAEDLGLARPAAAATRQVLPQASADSPLSAAEAAGVSTQGQASTTVLDAGGIGCDPAQDRERAQIEQALHAARGVISKAAAQLGLSRQALYRRMERLGLHLERRLQD